MAGFLYDPNSNYGYQGAPGPWGAAKSYLDTYLGNLDIEQSPEAYFTHVLAKQGLGGLNNRSMIARNLYGRTADDYGAARLQNNQLTWKSFLDTVDFDSLINQMTPGQRGENQSNVVPYNVRWLPR